MTSCRQRRRIFELLGKGSAWLHQPVEEWEQCQDYRDVASFLKDLKVVNDAAERSIKDVTDHRDIAQDSQYREDNSSCFQQLSSRHA